MVSTRKSRVATTLVFLLSLFVVAETLAQSQGAGRLTGQERKEFIRRRLSLEVEGRSVGMVSGTGTLGSAGIVTFSGLGSSASWRKWTAYEGFNPISEVEFYRKTGYLEEMKRAAGYKAGKKKALTLGICGMALGAGLAFGGLAAENYGLAFGGCGALAICAVPTAMNAFSMGLNWAPYSAVAGMADEYNERLFFEIKKKHKSR